LEMAMRVHEAGKQHAVAETVEWTVGQAWISRTTHPSDATRGNGDDTLADRRARDRKQPGGLDELHVRARAPFGARGRQLASDVASACPPGGGGVSWLPA